MSVDMKELLTAVQNGDVSVEDALLEIKKKPFVDLGYANIDTHRKARQGAGEVIYGESKTAEQVAGIARALLDAGEKMVLVTRLSKEKADAIHEVMEMDYHEQARIGIFGEMPEPNGVGRIVIATGGTSDIPVAEEAALTAECLGNEVIRLYDVGVAGIHRLMSRMDLLMSAQVVIAIAGMEGALASVVGGMVDCPVIAVPTSVGYGASFHGISALLSMLNSCASGVSVVNIDNGFGAGFLASRINHMEVKK